MPRFSQTRLNILSTEGWSSVTANLDVLSMATMR